MDDKKDKVAPDNAKAEQDDEVSPKPVINELNDTYDKLVEFIKEIENSNNTNANDQIKEKDNKNSSAEEPNKNNEDTINKSATNSDDGKDDIIEIDLSNLAVSKDDTADKKEDDTYSQVMSTIKGVKSDLIKSTYITNTYNPLIPSKFILTGGYSEFKPVEAINPNTGDITTVKSSNQVKGINVKKVIKSIDIKELTLPKLSIDQQINELDQIINGLQEGIFDYDHIIIIIQELYGTKAILDKAKKNKKNKVDENEKVLIDERDDKLNSAIAILGTIISESSKKKR